VIQQKRGRNARGAKNNWDIKTKSKLSLPRKNIKGQKLKKISSFMKEIFCIFVSIGDTSYIQQIYIYIYARAFLETRTEVKFNLAREGISIKMHHLSHEHFYD
jgi:hypothetical protein